jgi:hypothetical protein
VPALSTTRPLVLVCLTNELLSEWLTENGIRASKDFLTVEENNRLENSSEETVNNYWAKATKIAEEVLK